MTTKAAAVPSATSRKPAGGVRYLLPRNKLGELAGARLPSGVTITLVVDKPLPASTVRASNLTLVDAPVVEPAGRMGSAALPVGKSGVSSGAFAPDARARAMLRGIDIAETDLAAAGGAFDLVQVRKIMRGVSRQRILQRVKEGSLLAVPGPSNRNCYPTVQFNEDGSVVDGLKSVQETLGFSNPWSTLNFLINADERLNDERPIDLLRRGEIATVLESARRIGVQGA